MGIYTRVAALLKKDEDIPFPVECDYELVANHIEQKLQLLVKLETIRDIVETLRENTILEADASGSNQFRFILTDLDRITAIIDRESFGVKP